MVVNHFSISTIQAYLAVIKRLHNFHNLPPEELSEDQLVTFVCHLKEALGLSAATMRIGVSSIKYFYHHILDRKALCDKIPYPKTEKRIRSILTGAEVKLLFEKTTNLKHRLLLKLTYSGGLRRSELLTLRPDDFDWRNMQLLVRQAKGKKDRYTLLARSLKADFDRYMKLHDPKSTLFCGREKNQPLSRNSTGWIINQALKRAGITKSGLCLHSLRHSFASHLLAIHTDIMTVKNLMGHDDVRTTMEYFHLGNRPSSKPQSPMDIIYPAK